MRPVSDAFLRAVRGSHTMCSRARVVTGFPTGTNPTGTEIPILDGDVQFDSTADVRGTVSITTDGTRAWPQPDDLLAPYGNELFVERGIDFGTSREWVSMGYFRINTVEQDNAPDGPIRLAGRDRMANIIDARLLSPIQFAQGTSVEDIFDLLVGEVYPSLTTTFDFDAGGTTLATAQIADEERYGFLLDLARSLGKVFYFDYAGQPRLESAPDPTEPVFDVNHGQDGVLVAMSRALDRDGVYNAVVASGEHPDSTVAPTRAVARDMNPASPTYWLGDFGPVPRFYTSPFIATYDQAAAAAEAMLTKSIGLPYNVTFGAVPNPALEVLDPVRVRYSYRDAAETHVLEKLTIPLGGNVAMSAITREQTGITVEVSET